MSSSQLSFGKKKKRKKRTSLRPEIIISLKSLLSFPYPSISPFYSSFFIYFFKAKLWGAFDSAKNHKRQRRKRQSVTAKRGKSQTPKFV